MADNGFRSAFSVSRASFCYMWLLQNAELIGTVAGFVCVWLTVQQNVWNWPLGIINNAFFLVVLAQERLYANSVLQAIFIVLGFYGWWMWLYGGAGHSALQVSRSGKARLGALGLAWAGGTAGLAWFLSGFARYMALPPPDFVLWDSSVVAASLVAQGLLTWKKIENWWVWIIPVNLSQVFLFGIKGRYPMAALQVAYIMLSVQGYRAWRRALAAAPQEALATADGPAVNQSI